MLNSTANGYLARAARVLKHTGSVTWPLLVLCIINYATFDAQYDGRATFPWDFLGGYHAQAFGWYDEGGMLKPPSWFPWTSLGFPAFLALQSGAWYLPMQAMHAVGIAYTIHAATVFQVLHVLFGAIGIYFLARRLDASKTIALMMAIGFHFSAAFYSNQQNVDIVRAAAFIPWLLLVLLPQRRIDARLNVLIAALVLSQFLVAGYPGNIVATAYTCVIWVAFLAWKSVPPGRRKGYLLEVALAVTAGTLIAMPKWLPLVLNGRPGLSIEHHPPAPFAVSHLLTLMTPYTTNILPSDITMRSLWLPLTCMWGAAYANPKSKLSQIGALLAALALFMGMFVRGNSFLASLLPGMQVSRFPLADWRPIFQIGLILLSISGWTDFFTGRRSAARALIGSVVAFSIGTIIIVLAIRFGFDAHELLRVIIANSSLAVITLLYSSLYQSAADPRYLVSATTFMLIAFTAIGGFQYQKSQQAPWHPGWSKAIEQQIFGANIKAMIVAPRPADKISRRPGRMLLGSDPKAALGSLDSSLYNKCWYERTFCVFGYDNLKISEPYQMFLSAVSKPDGGALLNFAKAPQQLLALPRDDGNVMTALAAVPKGDGAPIVGDAAGMALEFLGYTPTFVQYKISTPRDVRFVANEMWWPGWKISVCGLGQPCSAYKATESTAQGLRTWALPKGTWHVNLRFFGPSPVPGYVCALLGLLLAITGCGFDLWRGRQSAARARTQ